MIPLRFSVSSIAAGVFATLLRAARGVNGTMDIEPRRGAP